MSSINSVVLVGRLTKDCEEVKVNDKIVCKFNLAVDRLHTKDKASFIPICYWNDKIGQYLTKGKRVGITGELIIDVYDTPNGKGTYTYINADNLLFLDSKEQEQQKPVEKKNIEDYRATPDDDMPF